MPDAKHENRRPSEKSGGLFFGDVMTMVEGGLGASGWSVLAGRVADFNGDTVIDFFDYLDFVAAFSSGC